MPSCKFEILVSAYLDGELTGEERELFEGHLASCDTCNHLVAEWREVEQALRRQTLRQALLDERAVADRVRKTLSRSGAFRRARRKSSLRRMRDHLSARWRQVFAAAAAVAALGVLVWGLSALGTPPGNPRPNQPRGSESSPRQPASLPRLLGEAQAVLARLESSAGTAPGAGRSLRDEVVRSELPTRLAVQVADAMVDDDTRAGVGRIELVLTLLANVPDDRADAEAASLAATVKAAKLTGEAARLRAELMSRAY